MKMRGWFRREGNFKKKANRPSETGVPHFVFTRDKVVDSRKGLDHINWENNVYTLMNEIVKKDSWIGNPDEIIDISHFPSAGNHFFKLGIR